jgi:hypothetical protein
MDLASFSACYESGKPSDEKSGEMQKKKACPLASLYGDLNIKATP